MKILTNNGCGREVNPYQKSEMKFLPGSGDPYIHTDINWKEFEQKVESLPVYDQSGKLFTGSGEVDCELIWQYKNGFKWVFDKRHDPDTSINYKYETRQIYRISTPIPQDFQKEKETKPSEKLEQGEEESVERLPIVQAGIDYCKLMGIESIGRPICAFIAGAAYQKSQPNLIEKEKVIELLEAEINKAVYLSTAHKVLLDFLTKIENLNP